MSCRQREPQSASAAASAVPASLAGQRLSPSRTQSRDGGLPCCRPSCCRRRARLLGPAGAAARAAGRALLRPLPWRPCGVRQPLPQPRAPQLQPSHEVRCDGLLLLLCGLALCGCTTGLPTSWLSHAPCFTATPSAGTLPLACREMLGAGACEDGGALDCTADENMLRLLWPSRDFIRNSTGCVARGPVPHCCGEPARQAGDAWSGAAAAALRRLAPALHSVPAAAGWEGRSRRAARARCAARTSGATCAATSAGRRAAARG